MTTQGVQGNSAENGVLGIPTLKGVIENEEVTQEVGNGQEAGREPGDNCQGS